MKFRLWLEMPMRTDLAADTFVNIDREPTRMRVAFVGESGHPNGLGEITVERELSADFWRVSWVQAEHRWGPFLYDVAMELATAYGSGLTADYAQRISTDAHDVWEHYFKRADVIKHPLPEDLQTQLPDHPTSFIYTKEPTRLKSLRAAGKII